MAEELFLLVDGHHLFHRTYNALPRSIVGLDGAPIQGVYGFAGALLRLVRRFAPTHLCVPFDPPETPFRRDLFPDYRTGRPRGTQEEVANFDAQVGQTMRVLDVLAVRYPMVPGYEADDVLGTLAARAATQDLTSVIVSGDRDLLQTVSPRVSLFMPKGQDGELWNEALVHARWGVSPRQFVDLKALIGDSSDRIPGVPGIGPRTAASLLAHCGTLHAIYGALGALPARQAALLREYRARVELNRTLVTLVTDLEAPGEPDGYRWSSTRDWSASHLLAEAGLRPSK
jgi:DNA polymerase-1